MLRILTYNDVVRLNSKIVLFVLHNTKLNSFLTKTFLVSKKRKTKVEVAIFGTKRKSENEGARK